MKRREVADHLDTMRQQMEQLITELEAVTKEWNDLVIQVQDLKMENHYLRERIQQLTEKQETTNDEEVISPAIQNLMNIYEEGFHICNVSYAQRRMNDEQCMFCLEILYGSRQTAKG